MPKSKPPSIRPVITLKPERYQPTKAELEEDVSIPITPEKLAKALGRKVIVRRDKKYRVDPKEQGRLPLPHVQRNLVYSLFPNCMILAFMALVFVSCAPSAEKRCIDRATTPGYFNSTLMGFMREVNPSFNPQNRSAPIDLVHLETVSASDYYNSDVWGEGADFIVVFYSGVYRHIGRVDFKSRISMNWESCRPTALISTEYP